MSYSTEGRALHRSSSSVSREGGEKGRGGALLLLPKEKKKAAPNEYSTQERPGKKATVSSFPRGEGKKGKKERRVWEGF